MVIHSVLIKPKPSTEDEVFLFLTTYKLWPDLLINEQGRLESSVIESSVICGTIYKHPGMKISDFNKEYLTPLLAKILQEEKTCLLVGDFNVNL